ncbi:bifunctional anthranilate synthase component II/anthranilate phosphoribosyltransferase [Helicobacter muridarum]|uniref:Anthranilate phosphoribosyltransferase n=1 Tax=Helicobacter muridarum TaxID=216 RepID=A0A099TZX1_9HELI|nr:bifunctional anthranilate synthase component II/anthranilate phosphoribosyltransferase [Helicobacter muridarum]TLE00360.1 bifunctional anthranilate synthase component II/anthranilate phosphoribosyltransferase [Helicobacter muridarum]STQ85869.1 bifunctional glutamine amidotransferase/anthranilate phosphoribosyltransferase [Helicobacter muridarum]
MVLLIDNYDSFTYNIYQLLGYLGCEVQVVRNDCISIQDIRNLNPTHIILGPGPNRPEDSIICIDIVKQLGKEYPILGICLGHEAILYAFGIPIVNADYILHGKISQITHSEEGIFSHIAQGISVVRYHSLVAKKEDINNDFAITAYSNDGEVMAVAHKQYPIYGLQFHPESIGTECGEKMIQNFLSYKRHYIPIRLFLHKLANLENLSFSQSYDLMECISEGELSIAQIASVITSFYIKKPVSDELGAFASLLIQKASKFDIDDSERIDIVGTGGSARKTFNVSSTVAILLASMGLKVVKHGNRGVTSKSGSADLLSYLGVNIDMSLEVCKKCYEQLGITFLFAPKIHSALKSVQSIRKELGFKSIFNLLGPLSNPLRPTYSLIGVFDKEYSNVMINTLALLGSKRAMVVNGLDGIDEFSICDKTQVHELKDGKILNYDFDPSRHGIRIAPFNEVKGGDVARNAEITMEILSGIESSRADLAALNAGASLYLYGKSDSIESGFIKAKEFLASKKALQTLENFVSLSQDE